MDMCEIITGYPLDRVVVFDTETTGLSPARDEILSVAVVDGHGRELVSSLVRPSRKRSWPEAQRINHISPQMVAGAPRIEELRDRLAGYLSGDYLAVSYNGSFDARFLHAAGVLANPWVEHGFDVMREFAKVHGKRRSGSSSYKFSKLVECAAHYDYSFGAHDAAEDARATAHCFRALLCDLKYVKLAVGGDTEAHRHPSTTQTKATTRCVLALLRGGRRGAGTGTLRMGSVTRGKNAGAPRYDVVMGESVVAHLSQPGMGDVRRFLGVSDDSDLPKEVGCKVILMGEDGKASCLVELVGGMPALSAVLAQMRVDRPDLAERREWSATVRVPASPMAPSPMEPSPPVPWSPLSHDEAREREVGEKVRMLEEVGRRDIRNMGPILRAIFVIVAVVTGLLAALCVIAIPSVLSRGGDVRPVIVTALMIGGISFLMASIARESKASDPMAGTRQ